MNAFNDLRFVLRLLVKQPATSLMSILVMAVGTGVAITMFAFVNGIMWSPMGVETDGDLLHVEWAQVGNERLSGTEIKPPDFEVFKSESQSFAQLEAFAGHSVSFFNPSGDTYAKRYEGVRATRGFFDLIGEKAMLGRTFRPEDVAGSEDFAVVLSYAAWQEQFGGAPEAVGADVVIDSRPHRVVGVMRPGFEFPGAAELWVATDWQEEKKQGRQHWRGLIALGVLKRGVTVDQARTELGTMAQRLAEDFPETNGKKLAVEIKDYSREVYGDVFANLMYAMLFCAALVLAVACANVFNVIVTRAAKRTSELSIRSALGATRGHIVFQVLLDGFLLTTLGTLGGIVIAAWALKLIWARIEPLGLPYWWNMDIDGSVVGFIAAVVLLATLASSLVPGLRAARSSTAENLKDDSRTSSSLFIGVLSKLILGLQVTFTGILLFVGVMMMIMWFHLDGRTFPFDSKSVLQGNLHVLDTGEYEDVGVFFGVLDQLREKLEAYPEVESLAYTSMYSGLYGQMRLFEMEGESYESDEAKPQATIIIASEDFEKVFGVEPLGGRTFNRMDTAESEPVCMVNKHFADRFWPNEDPVGKRLLVSNLGEAEAYRQVVGVMPNLMQEPLPGQDLQQGGFIKIYVPHRQAPWRWVYALVNTTGDPHALIEPMRRELRSIAPHLAFQGDFLTIEEINDRNMVGNDILLGLFGVFGLAALLKATVGLYAVMSFSTRQRFREFGIRMALGAGSRRILALALRQGLWLVGLGSILGVAIGHAVALIIKSILQAEDVPISLTYPTVIAILILSAVFAMGVPAWRATRIAPMKALRVG